VHAESVDVIKALYLEYKHK